MFKFFLESYRKGLLTFCGEDVQVDFDLNGDDGKITFKKFDNGEFKFKEIVSCHPNIVKGVIVGKKSWGLWSNEWTDGISEGLFTKKEILDEFVKRNIEIPEPFMIDFENKLFDKVMKRI
jgi:hypothetical protein